MLQVFNLGYFFNLNKKAMYYSLPVKFDYDPDKIVKVALLIKPNGIESLEFQLYIDNEPVSCFDVVFARDQEGFIQPDYIQRRVEMGENGKGIFILRYTDFFKNEEGSGFYSTEILKIFGSMIGKYLHSKFFNFRGISVGEKITRILLIQKDLKLTEKITYYKFFLKTHKHFTYTDKTTTINVGSGNEIY